MVQDIDKTSPIYLQTFQLKNIKLFQELYPVISSINELWMEWIIEKYLNINHLHIEAVPTILILSDLLPD